MDQKLNILPYDFKESGPFAKVGKTLNQICRMINGMHFVDGGQVFTNKDTIRLRSRPSLSFESVQFYPTIVASVAGVPQVKVNPGYHLTPYGATEYAGGTIAITGSGWIITRQPKAATPGAVSVVLQGTIANPVSTTNYESNVCKITYSGGVITDIAHINLGERNFVATV